MKPMIKKSLAVLAAFVLSLSVAPLTTVVQAQDTLSVVNLIPTPDTSALEKGLVTVRLVDGNGTVHKTLYYTSVNTEDVTYSQIYDLLKDTYDLDKTPRDRKTQSDKQHFVTDKGEFDGHSFEVSWLLTKPETVPVEASESAPTGDTPKTYMVTELPQKNPVVDAQLMTVKVQDQNQQDLATTHYLVNSETTEKPLVQAAQAFSQAHPDYQVDPSQAREVGTTDPNKKEEVLTDQGLVTVYRSTYILTATLADKESQTSEGVTSSLEMSTSANEASASQEVSASQEMSANTASASNQESDATPSSAMNQGNNEQQSSSNVQVSKETSSEVARYDSRGRRLPSTGELTPLVTTVVMLIFLCVAFTLVALDIRQRYLD